MRGAFSTTPDIIEYRMEYRQLGRTGVKVAPLCFGTDNWMKMKL